MRLGLALFCLLFQDYACRQSFNTAINTQVQSLECFLQKKKENHQSADFQLHTLLFAAPRGDCASGDRDGKAGTRAGASLLRSRAAGSITQWTAAPRGRPAARSGRGATTATSRAWTAPWPGAGRRGGRRMAPPRPCSATTTAVPATAGARASRCCGSAP